MGKLGSQREACRDFDRDLEDKVDDLMKTVNLMISRTQFCGQSLQLDQDFQKQREKAHIAKLDVIELVKSLAGDLSYSGNGG